MHGGYTLIITVISRMVRILAVGIGILLLPGCSSETRDAIPQTDEDSSAVSGNETQTAERSLESLLHLKQKIVTRRRNPILSCAMHDTHFNPHRWLKSDRKFFSRTNPRKISDYDPIIKKMARRYGFDWRLIAAQIYTESNFQNEAQSSVGARGLMQVMPSTAKFMGFDPKSMIHPETNIAVGCMYNQRMYNLWGRQTNDYNRLAFALASYNAGRGRVLKSYDSKSNHTIWEDVHSTLPEETQTYVHKIYLKYDIYKRYILP